MTEQNELKTSTDAGVSGTESPEKSPVRRSRNVPTSVYIIECAGYVKIGVAIDPDKRLRGVNTGAPVKASLVGSRQFDHRLIAHEIESRLHRRFASKRSNGEWFDITPAEAMRALNQAQAHNLRDPSARHDSIRRWDITTDSTITDLLTQTGCSGSILKGNGE